MHVDAALAPVDDEYLPATQSWHTLALDWPSNVKYFPATHAIQALSPLFQGDTFVMYLPATQAMQSDACAFAGDTAVVYVPAGQEMHVVSLEPLYFPAGQAIQ